MFNVENVTLKVTYHTIVQYSSREYYSNRKLKVTYSSIVHYYSNAACPGRVT